MGGIKRWHQFIPTKNTVMDDLEKTEREFDRFVSLISFSKVSQDVGTSPKFENADYVNKGNKVVIELKILNKEFFGNGGLIHSLNAFIVNPVNIDEKGLGQYKFNRYRRLAVPLFSTLFRDLHLSWTF